jgi:hypothetical protein
LGQDRDVTRKQDHSRAYARSFLAGFLEHGTPWQPWQPSAPEWSSRRRRSDRLFIVCARCDAASILSHPEVGVELVLPLRAKQKKTTRMTRASSSLAKRSPHGGARRITPSHRGTSNMALSILQENTASSISPKPTRMPTVGLRLSCGSPSGAEVLEVLRVVPSHRACVENPHPQPTMFSIRP